MSIESDAPWLAHAIEVEAEENEGAGGATDGTPVASRHAVSPSAPAAAAAPSRWYPLHQLARWSGVVAVRAPAQAVKQAMAEARATIEARCRASASVQADGATMQMQRVYRKIGNVVCVSESGFTWSVQGWTALHPDNAQLQHFADRLQRTRQMLFHEDTTHAGAGSGSAAGLTPADAASLCAQFAFDRSAAGDGSTLASASLAAPASSFSLAAFLDQHLQAPPASTRGTAASPVEMQRNEVAAVETLRSQVQQLQQHWQRQQQEAAQTNPPLVASESARVTHYLTQVSTLGQAHAEVQERLRAHLAQSQPLHARVAALQTNMAFIQHVQLYEHLLRQVGELSERCRDTIGGNEGPQAAAGSAAEPLGLAVTASALDMHSVQSVCAMFLRLLRIYQGLRDTTRAHTAPSAPTSHSGADGSETAALDGASPAARSWSGVLHLQRMARARILSILQPLKGRLVQLYQQTLAALNWPQTSNTLLLGIHALPPVPPASGDPGSVSVPLSSPSAHSLDSSLQLFDMLTENLIRIQMLLSECGMHDEIRRIEREIDGHAGRHAASSTGSAGEKRSDAGSPPRLWVLSLLLQPIYKRFFYHFDSSAAVISAPELSAPAHSSSGGVGGGASSATVAAASLTNRLDKPEWVCTFLEKTFVDHREFLQQRVQPIVNRCHWQADEWPRDPQQAHATGAMDARPTAARFHHYEFAMEFLESLLGFYHAKLIRPSTQAALVGRPPLLRHTLDELTSFEAKLEAMYGYPVQSSRRVSLLDAFLRQRSAFEALLKNERDHVNRALDALRNLPHPWQLVARRGAAATDGDSSDEEEDAGAIGDGLAAADSSQLEGGGDSLDGSSSLLHSAASATHSSHAFLSLISSLTRRYRSFKFLNLRLQMLKELQFKLFEIYEEDLIREFQENWKRLATNARAGGLQYLMLERGGKGAAAGGGGSGRRSKAARLNPLRYWSTHCGLLNSLYYISTILRDWNDDFIFLELFYYYTHKSAIQSSLLQAHRAAAADPTAPAPIGGVVAPSASASGSGSAEEEEEVLITSEELALWMTGGGSAVMQGATTAIVAPAAGAVDTAVDSHPAPSSPSSSYLPAGFHRTMKPLQALSSLQLHGSHGGPFNSVHSLHGASALLAPSALTPTSDVLFPKLASTDTRGSLVPPPRSLASSSSAFSLPLDLQMSGALFDPILASYSSLREEMMHSLVGVVANHFRDALHQHGYVAQGHMDAQHAAHADAFRHPDLADFFARAHSAPEGVAPAAAADWLLLEHHVDISPSLCQPLLDLKMQLTVVHHSLTHPLHRSFWTSVAAKLNQLLFDELVVRRYFTRRGSLQWMRDMRAIFVLFAIYQQPQQTDGSSATSALNPHFKLVQDTIHLLLLSSAQLSALQAQLTHGGLASASAAAVRQFLARPPLLLQKLNATQVLDLIAHIRDDEADGRTRATQAEAEEHAGAEESEDRLSAGEADLEDAEDQSAPSEADIDALDDEDAVDEEDDEDAGDPDPDPDSDPAGCGDAADRDSEEVDVPAPEDLDDGFQADDLHSAVPMASSVLNASAEDEELCHYAAQAQLDDERPDDDDRSPTTTPTPTPAHDDEAAINLDDFAGFPDDEQEEEEEPTDNDAVPQ